MRKQYKYAVLIGARDTTIRVYETKKRALWNTQFFRCGYKVYRIEKSDLNGFDYVKLGERYSRCKLYAVSVIQSKNPILEHD